ncbi:MAG TPA: ABC transporter permease [Thermoanaerobaculia bacterium]|nr:ABC transporter permease [Thermoanaerobaculia bacterium]
MNNLSRDLRYALRTLATSPGFTLVAVLTLALGIGVTGSVASVVRTLLLRPLPYAQPDRLTMIWSRWSSFPKTWVSVPEYRAYQEIGSFSGVALFSPGQSNLTGGETPERVGSGYVSANLFDVLGVHPILGRAFTPAEVSAEPAPVVVLSEELWRQRFGGERTILGTSIDVNGAPRTVVGVMPAGFRLPVDYSSQAPSTLWLPLAEDLHGPQPLTRGGGSHSYNAIARLAPGVSLEQAQARLRAWVAANTSPDLYTPEQHFETLVIPVVTDILGSARIALLVLAGAVGFVLLIACANVANLVLVRGLKRRRELAVRMALGAAPGQLIRQLVTESALLALFGGLAGLWLARLGVQAILWARPVQIPRVGEIGIDGGIVAFILLVAFGTTLLFGLAPALRLVRPDLQASLKAGAPNMAGAGGGGFQSLIVVAEVALAVVLLMGAGLMIRTFLSLSQVDPGFRSANVLTLGVSPARVKYPQPEDQIRLYDEMLTEIRRLPGVQAAGAVRILPLAREMGDWGLTIEGYTPPDGGKVNAAWQAATPGYFEALSIPVREGRVFTAADRRDAQPVVVISETFARNFWPRGSALGHRIKIGQSTSPWSTIVGVVGDVRHEGLTADAKQTWYLPQSQLDLSIGFPASSYTLVLKTQGNPATYAGAVREVIRSIDPQLPASDVRPLADVVSGAFSKQSFTMFFLVLCSTLALGLAAVGVYGVIRFRVGARTREIGLRMALGARVGQVIREVVAQSMGLVGIGLALGLAAALALTHFLNSLLYGVGAQDPGTILASVLALGLVALLATYLPARAAAAVDPMIALRGE